jgi:hypothetical protein
MQLALLTTVANESRTMLSSGLIRGWPAASAHQCTVGHCGAAVHLYTVSLA